VHGPSIAGVAASANLAAAAGGSGAMKARSVDGVQQPSSAGPPVIQALSSCTRFTLTECLLCRASSVTKQRMETPGQDGAILRSSSTGSPQQVRSNMRPNIGSLCLGVCTHCVPA
jgi:hypothetical protein